MVFPEAGDEVRECILKRKVIPAETMHILEPDPTPVF
jgi:hypothetical protein